MLLRILRLTIVLHTCVHPPFPALTPMQRCGGSMGQPYFEGGVPTRGSCGSTMYSLLKAPTSATNAATTVQPKARRSYYNSNQGQ
jgi:hypothetical protein